MNDEEKLQLQRMIKENDVENQTSKIRELKHSELIKLDVAKMLRIKHDISDPNILNDKLSSECNFLFTYYTDIFNKIKKNEIDISILGKFLDTLKRIENNEIDQHEGSYIIGSLLKNMYVDSALRKSEHNEHNTEPEEKVKPKNINWKEYKNMSSI
tara:strand:+ start:663 stop:1130 length:468 start_codon:yes stop_codon:yes gene_type:complete